MSNDLRYFEEGALLVWDLAEQGFPAAHSQGIIRESKCQQCRNNKKLPVSAYLASYSTGTSGRSTLSSPTSARTAGGTPSTSTACSWSNLCRACMSLTRSQLCVVGLVDLGRNIQHATSVLAPQRVVSAPYQLTICWSCGSHSLTCTALRFC